MTTAEIHVTSETELERVEHWRAEELIRAGYTPTDAVALAARHDIDLHRAVELMTLGCPYELGIVGARAYHDITSWSEVSSPKWKGIFAVWEGGLGVWGGILLGCLAGAIVVRRSGERVRNFMDAVAPGLLLAQGIGRWGNWFNQELYGKPTSLPWGVKIGFDHRVAGYEGVAPFQPPFL